MVKKNTLFFFFFYKIVTSKNKQYKIKYKNNSLTKQFKQNIKKYILNIVTCIFPLCVLTRKALIGRDR